MEVVITIELGLPIECTTLAYANAHFASIELFLDLADERQDEPAIQMVAYHQQVMVQYNKRVRSRKFHLEDLIIRHVFENTKEPEDGQLSPNWEGPLLGDTRWA